MRHRPLRAGTAAAAAALAAAGTLAGCAADPAASPDDPPSMTEATVTSTPRDPATSPTTAEPSAGPTAPEPSGSTTAVPTSGPVATAAQDLAERLGVGTDAVGVVRAEEVTWRDGALGCPRPGMSYTQALVDGMLIELEAGGERYRYHSGGGRGPFLCDDPQEPVGG